MDIRAADNNKEVKRDFFSIRNLTVSPQLGSLILLLKHSSFYRYHTYWQQAI